MTADPIRVGFIGAGGNTRAKHIPGLQQQEGVELVAVCNRSEASGQRVATEFGLQEVHTDWRAIAEHPELDAVVIGTWPYLHCEATCVALAAGKHVLCEARMAADAAEARRMAAAAEAHPACVAQVVPSPFSLTVDSTIRRRVEEGWLGAVTVVRIDAQQDRFPDFDAPLHWREDERKSGLNTLSLGIWYEALMRWVGPAELVQAQAQTVVGMRRDPEDGSDRPVGIPDHLDVLAHLQCGALASLHFSSVTGGAPPPGAWLFGTEGTLCFRPGENRLYAMRRDDDALQPVEIPAAEQGGWRVEEEFVNAIRGREPVRLTTFADGVRYMEFTEAVRRSAAETCAVALPLASD